MEIIERETVYLTHYWRLSHLGFFFKRVLQPYDISYHIDDALQIDRAIPHTNRFDCKAELNGSLQSHNRQIGVSTCAWGFVIRMERKVRNLSIFEFCFIPGKQIFSERCYQRIGLGEPAKAVCRYKQTRIQHFSIKTDKHE